jgi:hypothetical protein
LAGWGGRETLIDGSSPIDVIDAPSQDTCLFENSAHCRLIEVPEDALAILLNDVLERAMALAAATGQGTSRTSKNPEEVP